MGYTIDLYALSNFVSQYDGFAALNKEESLVNKLYLYDYAEIAGIPNGRDALTGCWGATVKRCWTIG